MRMRYYVNEERRTVVALIVDCEYDVIRKVKRKLNNKFGDSFMFRGGKSYLPEKFVGKAKCYPEDIFDIEVGKKLAAERAMEKYKRTVNRELTYICHELQDMIEEVCPLIYLDENGDVI